MGTGRNGFTALALVAALLASFVWVGEPAQGLSVPAPGTNEANLLQSPEGVSSAKPIRIAAPALNAPARSIQATPVIAIAAGFVHTIALRSDGTVWAWGSNSSGQLGNGGGFDRSSPVQVSGLSSVTAIVAGGYHNLALKGDGTLWAWGRNGSGQLGDGTTQDKSAPVQVQGISGVITALAGGGNFSVVLKDDGTVWTWGDNEFGHLGDGTNVNRSSPAQVSGLTGITAITTGFHHTLVVKGALGILGWGNNERGQLGDGTTVLSRPAPVPLSAVTSVVGLGAGFYHTIAITATTGVSSTVWAWGSNTSGQLGDGTTTNSTGPVQSGPAGTTAVAGGSFHTVSIKGDGTMWAWGSNDAGQLGDGTAISRSAPAQVTGLSGVIAVDAGNAHSVALKSDGTVWTMGSNTFGQLGDGTSTDRSAPVQSVVPSASTRVFLPAVSRNDDGTEGSPTPGPTATPTSVATSTPTATAVSGGSAFTAVSAAGGGMHTVARKTDGTVWAWGDNTYGQLGNGASGLNNGRLRPAQASGLSGVGAVAAGQSHTVSLKADGTVWTWGRNQAGQLGDGSSGESSAKSNPVQVSGLSGATAIAAGFDHSVALKGDGTVWSWGNNTTGALGDGTTSDRASPVQVSGLTGVVAIAAGGNHSLALKGDGTVWAWGDNQFGDLGDGTTDFRKTPVQVAGLSGVSSLAAGGYHSLAVKGDGTAWAWGRNDDGQLGAGTTVASSTPVQIVGLSGVTALAGGFAHTLARKDDGTVWAWGRNTFGELGDGTTASKSAPVLVPGLSGVAGISAGADIIGRSHSIGVKSDETLWSWGYNSQGQLGDGTTGNKSAPIQVSQP